MATIIKSVGFQNFYNYYGCFEDNTYHFKEGIKQNQSLETLLAEHEERCHRQLNIMLYGSH